MISDEKLYQFIDGELSEKEYDEIAKMINSSDELKSRVERLKIIVNAPKLITPLNPAPYFVTSLIENKIKVQRNISMKKFAPIFGLIALTIVLMIFYKYNLKDLTTIVYDQKSQLVEYYTKNLKPLFFTTQLSTDDVFSFAFNHVIPLDKDKSQFIKLGTDETGKSYFEIRSNLDINNLKTKEDFSKQLNLNADRKKSLDTILNKYIDKIESQIVLGDKHSIGVNENLWQLSKAIAVDVLKFAQETNGETYSKVIPTTLSFINNPKIDEFIFRTTNNKNKNFVFITPDTIFSIKVFVDTDKQKRSKEYEQAIKEYSKQTNQLSVFYNLDTSLQVYKYSKKKGAPFSIEIRDSVFRFKVPHIESIQIPNIDSILKAVEKIEIHLKDLNINIPKIDDKASKSLQLKLKILNDSLKNLEVKIPELLKMKIFEDSLKEFDLNVNSFVDSVLKLSLKGLENIRRKDFGKMVDSLSRSFKFDFNEQAFDKEKFKKEMEKFREEIEKWKKDFERQYKENLKKKEKKNIEEI